MSGAGRHLGRVLVLVCMLGLLLVGAPAAMAAPGELDSGFGSGGVFTGSFQTEPSPTPPRDQSAAVDSQGRTVIAATHVDAQNRRHLDVMRLTAQGTLDTSFNPQGPTPGIVEVDFSAYVGTIDVNARGVAVVGGDGIVALGWVHDTNGNDFTALVRLNSDGSYDATFGANHDGRTVDFATNHTGFPHSLAVDNLGRILVGGSCGSSCRGVVARYTSTGALDSTGFNSTDALHPGVLAIAQGGEVSSLAFATDGSGDVLAADGSSTSGQAVIARIRPDGTLDPTFNSGGATPGVVVSGMGCQACANSGGAYAFGAAAGPGGTVYATGQVSDPGGAQSMRLLRLTQGGNPDPGFGTGSPATGVVTAPSGTRGVSVAVDGSACPVIVGYGMRSDQTNAQIVAARFTGAGQLDQAFNPAGATPGIATFPLGSRALGETVALGADGQIVIGGEVDQFGNATTRNAVALRLQGGGCGTQQGPIPTVVTGQATNTTSSSATLNGTVNPNGAQVSNCHFDYGTTTSYGSSIPCAQSPGGGTSPVPVSTAISGLVANTTYDYRLVAAGPGGSRNGDNQTLTTSPQGTPTRLGTSQTWNGADGGSASGASITIPPGSTDEYDQATIVSQHAQAPTGTVTFTLYSQRRLDGACTGPVFSSTAAVSALSSGGSGVSGSGVGRASSDHVSNQLSPGTYYWIASYSGDSDNQPSTSACGDEVLTVQPPTPTTVGTSQTWNGVGGDVASGASITVPADATGEYDQASIVGQHAMSPTGTVTFTLYSQRRLDGACTGPVFSSTTAVSAQGVEGAGRASSEQVSNRLAPGTYYWTAAYSGDSQDQPSTSACGAETLTVQPPPVPTTVTTIQTWGTSYGASIAIPAGSTGEEDHATIRGSNGSQPAGTVTYTLYSDSRCTTQVTRSTTSAFSGSSNSDLVTTQLSPGTYYWTAAYSGDSQDQPSTSACGDEILTVQPPPVPTTVTTIQTWGTTYGASIAIPAGSTGEEDHATIRGSNGSQPAGTVTYTLYSDSRCTTQVTRSTTSAFSGSSNSDLVTTQLSPGTYYWTAAYSGDSQDGPSTSRCGDEILTVSAPISIPRGTRAFSVQISALGIRCTALPCRVVITITLPIFLQADVARHKTPTRRPIMVLAVGAATITRQGAQTVRLRLTAAGRRFVASHNGQVTGNATVAMTIHGHTRVLNQRLKITIMKASKHRQH